MERIPLVGSQKLTFYGRYRCIRSKANYLFPTVICNHFRHHILSFHYEYDTKQKTKDPWIIVFYNIGFLYPMVSWYPPILVQTKIEVYIIWQEELRWDEMLIRHYQGREVWKLACCCSSHLWFWLVECMFAYAMRGCIGAVIVEPSPVPFTLVDTALAH